MSPVLFITRWHGMIIGCLFLLRAFPTARLALGLPAAVDNCLYVVILPFGICFASSSIFFENSAAMLSC